jgi:hypothetical protein
VVAIAQLVEHWIVIPGVAGSSPVGHPIFFPSSFPFSVRQISTHSVRRTEQYASLVRSICLSEKEK